MASKTDMKNMHRLLETIKKNGAIDKYQLIMQSGLSISLYDKLKPFLLEVFKHQVDYDSKSKLWTWLVTEEIGQAT